MGRGGGCHETKTVCWSVKRGKLQKSNHLYNVEHVVESNFQKMLITF